MCVCERERERDINNERERGQQRQQQHNFHCVCMCVNAYIYRRRSSHTIMARLIHSKGTGGSPISSLLHAILGLVSILHYGYRFVEYWCTGTTMDFTTTASLLFILLHTVLSLSALQFTHVPLKRIKSDRPMIWKEFRPHNVIFAVRSFGSILVFWHVIPFWSKPDDRNHDDDDDSPLSPLPFIWKILIVFTTMACADHVTQVYGDRDNKTMRAMPLPKGFSQETYKKLQRMYSISQFSATIAAVHSPSTAFMAAMPVQVSAFLMTLVRKNKLSPLSWHMIYSFTLWLPFFSLLIAVMVHDAVPNFHYFVCASLAARMRLDFGINKYYAWLIALTMAHFNVVTIPMTLVRIGYPLLVFKDAIKYVSCFRTFLLQQQENDANCDKALVVMETKKDDTNKLTINDKQHEETAAHNHQRVTTTLEALLHVLGTATGYIGRVLKL